MRLVPVILSVAFAAMANAHFQLQYPLPRGVYSASSEPLFCDGYTNVTPNRTLFPIGKGVINVKIGHTPWVGGVMISTAQNPTSFADFSYQMPVPYFQENGTQFFCIPINIEASGLSGIQEGSNVTIQIFYNSGDQPLYQCADLTLSATATIPGSATSNCTQANISTTVAASPTKPTNTSSTGSPSQTPSSAGKNVAGTFTIALVVLACAVGLL